MDDDELLAAFDELRRHPRADEAGGRIERTDHVLREIHADWRGVTWSDLAGADVDTVIAEQIAAFAAVGGAWEWKLYSYDLPADLPHRLLAAGFRAEEEETVMVGDLERLPFRFDPPAGVEVVRVADEAGIAKMTAVQADVFGAAHAETGAATLAAIREEPPGAAALVAIVDGAPVAAGRIALHPGTGFVSMWGGGVVADQRRRGVFRALLSRARAIALDAGYRYAYADAGPQSEPIFRRLGFVALCKTTPYVMRPAGEDG
ncbi:MAG TPA: GNAT family N-acetyltransferase [Solirubrobacteraceae bacterium]|nr:GNAT family N-acetyltransferase [Solirubrobacteraceae bacterium]